MKTPLDQLTLKCAHCGDVEKISDINSGQINFHNEQGTACRFPKDGLTEEQIIKVNAIAWACECCQDDLNDR